MMTSAEVAPLLEPTPSMVFTTSMPLVTLCHTQGSEEAQQVRRWGKRGQGLTLTLLGACTQRAGIRLGCG